MVCPFCKEKMIEFKGAKMPITKQYMRKDEKEDGIIAYKKEEMQYDTRVERCLKCGFVASFLKF